MKQYDVKNVKLACGETYAYLEAGHGEKTVLLVHGNMSSSAHWQPVIEALEGEYRVFAPDLRGFGDSTYNREFNSLGELADEIWQFCDALGIGDCYMCGWSTGGGIVMEAALARPEQVKGLILLDSVPPSGYPMFVKGPDFQPILTQPMTTKEQVAADPVQVLPALNALKSGDRATMKSIWDMVIYNLRKPPDEDYEVYLDGIMKQRNLVDVDYALMVFNVVDRLPGLACPVTILHGAKDMVVPFAWIQAALDNGQFGADTELVTFADAGHSPLTDVPEEFIAALRSALEKE